MSTLSRAYRMGADAERAVIVAWLRKCGYARDDRADIEWSSCLFEAADFIDRGEHHNIEKEPTEQRTE